MEAVPDNGKSWRNWITPILKKRFGLGVFDPCNKPCDGYEEDREKTKILRDNNDLTGLAKMYKPIVGVDLRMVHKADFLIIYIDKDIFCWGTPIEFAWAIMQRKPCLTVCKQGISSMPGFIFGMQPLEYLFNNFDELLDYLHCIDTDHTINNLRRWEFFDHERIY